MRTPPCMSPLGPPPSAQPPSPAVHARDEGGRGGEEGRRLCGSVDVLK